MAVLAINMVALLVTLRDKALSRKKGAERISEGAMFFLAAAFGSAGIFAGMLLFRHKTRKWYFIIGIPLLMLENAAALFLAYTYFRGGA